MTAQEYEQFLHDAEIKLARLKALYEQWFQGIERTEPVIVRKDLDRSLEMLKKNMPRNTALRFRTQQLSARYGTYGIYWGRIGRQIEEGTYKRVLARASRHAANAAPKREESAWEIDVDVDVEVAAEAPAKGIDFSDGDLDAILGALTTEEEKPKTKPKPSLSPFGFGAGLSRPPAAMPAGASTRPVAPPPAASARPVAPPPAASARPIAPLPAIAAPAAIKPPAPAALPPRPVAPVPVSRPAVPMARPAAAAPNVRPAAPLAAARPAVAPAGPPPSSSSLDEGRMRAIHASYVDARKRNNEGADVRYETLAESVQKMIPKLKEKHGGKAIDFEVVVQNGKVGLKPKVSG